MVDRSVVTVHWLRCVLRRNSRAQNAPICFAVVTFEPACLNSSILSDYDSTYTFIKVFFSSCFSRTIQYNTSALLYSMHNTVCVHVGLHCKSNAVFRIVCDFFYCVDFLLSSLARTLYMADYR